MNKKTGHLFSIVFMLSNFSSKYVSRNILGIPRYLLLSARFGIAFIFLIPVFLLRSEKMVTKNLKLQLLRSAIICIIIFLTYFGYANLPLGLCSAISISEPVFVAIFSCIFGFENRRSLPLILSITGIGAFGMFLMIKQDFKTQITLLPIIALVLSNIICSLNHFLTIKLTKQDSIVATLMYNVIFVSTILMACNTVLVLSGYTFDFQSIPPNRVKLIGLGFFAATSSWIGLSALNRLDANIHVNIQNLSLPLSVIFSYFEGDPISVKILVGTLAILITLFLLEYRKKNTKFNIVPFIIGVYFCIFIFYLTS